MQILPYFRVFEQSKGINIDEDGFTSYPKFYRSLDVDQNECIFFENLNNRGFTMLDKHREITLNHIRLYVNALAKFHAISFAINDQQPEKFKQLTSNLTDIYMYEVDEAAAGAYHALQADYLLKILSAPDDAHLYLKLKDFFAKGAFHVGIENIKQQLNESATVILHGDAHQNNTMFRYDCNDNPVDICLIDWQLSRRASPIIDFIQFVFFCMTKEMRDIHYDDLLKTYHDQLSTHIRR